MAEAGSNSTPPTAGQQTMSATEIEAALAHLEMLQDRIDSLRTTIPSLVSPLAQSATSRAEMFGRVRKAAVQSAGDLKAFREEWGSERTRGLLARGREGYGEVAKA
ncbi:uncharacterized protein LTR77_005356 [Saxophila tyrrhenica]|uniref:Uncharacterized protein n=1 Tax=Saxophila tyrrhenica TaxID=1690608 RepID=A0AAV9P889_9PEZI|nr:hypothetical protein LTR77_005356 [Saxophila tyrrhenica]